VNVAWDGGDHAFLLDTKTHSAFQHKGIGTRLVELAARHAKAAGCVWLHVDFETDLEPFYFDACGFRPTSAGLIHLPSLSDTSKWTARADRFRQQRTYALFSRARSGTRSAPTTIPSASRWPKPGSLLCASFSIAEYVPSTPSFRHLLAETLRNQDAKVHETVGEAFDVAWHAHVVQAKAGIASAQARVRVVFVVLLPALRPLSWHCYRSFRMRKQPKLMR
jgi:hypothetical protein